MTFCGKTSTKKIEDIQQRTLRFMFNDRMSTYLSLLHITPHKTHKSNSITEQSKLKLYE